MQNLQYYIQETPCDILIYITNSSILMFTLKKDRPRKAYVGSRQISLQLSLDNVGFGVGILGDLHHIWCMTTCNLFDGVSTGFRDNALISHYVTVYY